MASLFEKIISIFWPQGQMLKSVDQDDRPSRPPSPQNTIPTQPQMRPSVTLEMCRKWRLTDYYLASQEDHKGPLNVPILDKYGKTIDMANDAFFSSLSLEGSGITSSGKLVNVAGTWVSCGPFDYSSVLDYHKKFLSKRAFSYSGLQVVDDKVTKVLSFYEVPHEKFGKGFGICNNIPLDPYRTLAADIGKGKKSDPKFISGGGVVPLGTHVYIHEFVGTTLPDGTAHDGWFVVADTGGGIFGAHFDVFVGHHDKTVKVPSVAHIWFDGIEKLPDPYTYGLLDQ
jgi:hypothetical protein